jgi:hypothetical protein
MKQGVRQQTKDRGKWIYVHAADLALGTTAALMRQSFMFCRQPCSERVIIVNYFPKARLALSTTVLRYCHEPRTA